MRRLFFSARHLSNALLTPNPGSRRGPDGPARKAWIWGGGAPRRAFVRSWSLLVWTALALLCVNGCKSPPKWEKGKRYFHYSTRAKIGTLDPVRAASTYDSLSQAQVYETLFDYEYLTRPFKLQPLLVERMPEVSDDSLIYRFELKRGVLFHDNPCFQASGGVGREATAQDVIWSLMRMADRANSPTGWWLYRDRIKGFDAFKDRMDKRPQGAPFDWNAKVEGLRLTGRYTFEIHLIRPYPQLLNVLAMATTAVVPRECAEHYGDQFSTNPVGTGPFKLDEWVRGSFIKYSKNPKYREEFYPRKADPEFEERGLLRAAGKRIPFLDGIVIHVFEQDQPMWLKFRVGDLDATQTPAEYAELVFEEDKSLRPTFEAEGIGYNHLPLLDFIYRGFNMEDPVFGGMQEGATKQQAERARNVRRAISLALDTKELNHAFYNDHNVLYDGPIPPGLAGHKREAGPFRGPNLERARQLLAEAGYPGGKGLPPLVLDTSRSGNSEEQGEMVTRQLAKIGVKMEVRISSFPELQDKMRRKKSQFFGLAWSADYPDAENFLQLFYGPNKTPGSNKFNYDNPKYNELFEKARVLAPSPERDALYAQMRDILIEDCVAIGSMARTRDYVWNKRVHNFSPSETWDSWFKYLDVDPL